MPKNIIAHERLLPDYYKENPLWVGLMQAVNDTVNPNIQGAVEHLERIRYPSTESYYAFLNARMLGFKIPSLSFTDAEYAILMRNLGRYYLTCGSGTSFINFLSYVKKVELIYIDLWANSLDMPIANLVQDHGTPIWQGGDWFPTSYFDIVYSLIDFPSVDETQFRTFIQQLAPKHLVLRQIVGINATTTHIYMTAIPIDRQRNFNVARPV